MKVETRVESVQKARTIMSIMRRTCSVGLSRCSDPKSFLLPPPALLMRSLRAASCLSASGVRFCPAPSWEASFSMRRSTSRTLSRYWSSLWVSSSPRERFKLLASSRTISRMDLSGFPVAELPDLLRLRKRRSKAMRGLISQGRGTSGFFQEM